MKPENIIVASGQFTRRSFLLTVAASGAVLATGAHAQNKVDEASPQAASFGYVADAKRVDKAKFPRFQEGQMCSNCALYQGAATDPIGGCALFGADKVAGPGWCNAWSKRP